ncbi:FMN-linked oxidoreductase [Hortaea werneckii]|nr:FMN-linked oxidoreductase [Hortaea werneckii]
MSVRYESENVSAEPLGQPLKFEFSGKTASNRFIKGAMTERLSSWDPKNLEARGVPSKNLVNVYRRWGEGGMGHILTGNIMFEYDHLEAAGNPIIPRGSKYEGERFERFREMAEQGKKHGSLMVGQVSHPGRQVQDKIQPNPISASDVQLKGDVMGMTFAQPRAATEEDIKNVKEGFAHAAEYLEKAGYDGIQLHGAHGYLLAQFLSPTTNLRTDQYGGSLANRARLILEIAQEIRSRTSPSFILGIKLNSVEFQDRGFDPEEAKQLCAMLEENRFDFVELSGGTYESLAFVHKRESSKRREAFFMEFADLIAPALTKTRTYVTGGFKTVGAMVNALNTVDGVGLARPVCQEPRFCADVLAGKVKGAIKMQLDNDNFGITNVAAGTQIRQMGKDQEPIDLSKGENVDAFMKDMGTWADKMGKDSEMQNYGYIDISSAAAVPYGGPSV